MEIREMHLIHEGRDIVYTSIQELDHSVIKIEFREKTIFLIYKEELNGIKQIDSFTIDQLEELVKYHLYTKDAFEEVLVCWNN